jgi:hypothetical protein
VNVTFEDFTMVTLKNVIFWGGILCGSSQNRRFGGLHCYEHH